MNTQPNPTITLKNLPYKLTWNKGAMFRADEVGAYETGKRGTIGFAQMCKYLWALGPAELRAKYPSPEAIADDVPTTVECWAAINAAMEIAGEGMSPKNVVGSTNGPSPSSS